MTNTECRCLCAPAGHHASVCAGLARPGKVVPLAGAQPSARVPACGPCHRATVTAAAGFVPVSRPGPNGRVTGNPVRHRVAPARS
jgi:hypothetical protein